MRSLLSKLLSSPAAIGLSWSSNDFCSIFLSRTAPDLRTLTPCRTSMSVIRLRLNDKLWPTLMEIWHGRISLRFFDKSPALRPSVLTSTIYVELHFMVGIGLGPNLAGLIKVRTKFNICCPISSAGKRVWLNTWWYLMLWIWRSQQLLENTPKIIQRNQKRPKNKTKKNAKENQKEPKRARGNQKVPKMTAGR